MTFNYEVLEDQALIDYLSFYKLSRSKIYTLFLEHRIKLNGNDCHRNSKIKKGDIISIQLDEEIDFPILDKKLDIVYEDDYLLIVNKPNNIIVHPDDKSKNGSLCSVVANYYKHKGYDLHIRYAHRLDIETTGIIIFCKDILTMAYMNYIISTHEIKRYYRCLATGRFKERVGTIDAPIGEDRHHKQRRRVSKTGQSAITHYQVISEYKDYSLVEVLLETGRTHQIRVHFKHINHPLLGDTLYGGFNKLIKRVALHSYRLEFIHPVTREKIELVKKLPFDMAKLV